MNNIQLDTDLIDVYEASALYKTNISSFRQLVKLGKLPKHVKMIGDKSNSKRFWSKTEILKHMESEPNIENGVNYYSAEKFCTKLGCTRSILHRSPDVPEACINFKGKGYWSAEVVEATYQKFRQKKMEILRPKKLDRPKKSDSFNSDSFNSRSFNDDKREILYDIHELAALLKIKEDTIYKWIKKKKFPDSELKTGTKRRIHRVWKKSIVDEWLRINK